MKDFSLRFAASRGIYREDLASRDRSSRPLPSSAATDKERHARLRPAMGGSRHPCFNVAAPLKSRHHSADRNAHRSGFLSDAHQSTLRLRKQHPSTVIRASASQDDKSEQYKEFAKFLGDPDPDFLRKGNKHDEADAIEEQAVGKSQAEIAKNYEKMAQLLGPPTGRFGAKDSSTKAQSVSSDTIVDETSSSEILDEAIEMPPEPPIGIERFETLINAKEPVDADDGFEEMAQLLGPPSGRFQGKSPQPENIAAPENAEDSTTEFAKSVPDAAGQPNSQPKESPDPKPYWKEALSQEDEYALFETLLRKSGGRGNKPRKGGRQHVTWAEKVEGFVRDPWNVDFNLSPKKGKPRIVHTPPPKGTPPLERPEEISMTTEQIEQSYWTLEKLLDDEDAEWQEEQAAKKAEEDRKFREKKERKLKAKLLKKPAHPDDRPQPATSAEVGDATPVVEKKPKSVLRAPPKRNEEAEVDESLVEDIENIEVKPAPVLQQPPKRAAATEKIASEKVATEAERATSLRTDQSAETSFVPESKVELAPAPSLQTPPKRRMEAPKSAIYAVDDVVTSDSNGFSEASVDGESIPVLEKPPVQAASRRERRLDDDVFYLEDPKLIYFLDEAASGQ